MELSKNLLAPSGGECGFQRENQGAPLGRMGEPMEDVACHRWPRPVLLFSRAHGSGRLSRDKQVRLFICVRGVNPQWCYLS